MSQKQKNKKKLSILFILSREEKVGGKDIDHILPILYFLSKSDSIKFKVKLLIFADEFRYKNDMDPRFKFLINLKNVEVEFLIKDNLFIKFKRLLKLKKNSVLEKVYSRLFPVKKLNIIRNNKSVTDFIKSEHLRIITLHDLKEKKLIEFIKKINKKAKWITFPHGTVILDNNMVLNTDLSKHKMVDNHSQLKMPDYIMVVSKRDLANKISIGVDSSKLTVIGSPRYCKSWLKIKSKFKIDGKDVNENKKYKVKILFLIPKKFINIFTEELINTINFISSYQNIEMILLYDHIDYPKLPSYILKRDNIRHYEIGNEYSTSKLIEWSDIVLHVGTGVIFESFMKKKITVLPRYLSCNTLISDKYNAGWNLSNRDELRNLCNAAVSSMSILKKKYRRETWSSNNRFVNDFVYGNVKSVRKKIQKVFRSSIFN